MSLAPVAPTIPWLPVPPTIVALETSSALPELATERATLAAPPLDEVRSGPCTVTPSTVVAVSRPVATSVGSKLEDSMTTTWLAASRIEKSIAYPP
jgi:hypothetical protein